MITRLIVLGASAGGFESLKEILPAIPLEFKIPLVIVLHITAEPQNKLADLFTGLCRIKVKEAEDKELIKEGTVYFAPSGYHLLVESDLSLSLSVDEPVKFSRPSIDVLFDSAAYALKEDVLAIVLSGANSDGAAGVARILELGGAAFVEDPIMSQYPIMPQAALDENAGKSKIRKVSLAELKKWFADSKPKIEVGEEV